MAPDLLLYEVGSIVLRKLCSLQANQHDAEAILETLASAPIRPAPRALHLARVPGASFHHVVCPALAEERQSPLVRADEVLIGGTRRAGLGHLIAPLAELSVW